MTENRENQDYQHRLAAVERTLTFEVEGRICALKGLTVQVKDFPVPVGAQCQIATRHGGLIGAEVIGFRDRISVLMPLDPMNGISRGDRVRCCQGQASIEVGDELLGRVIDACGRPIDGRGHLQCQVRRQVIGRRIGPLERVRIDTAMGTGIRAVDTLLTCGRGQRMGIFSGPGVGKSVLLGMIAKNTTADVCVIALVGERGREVREFIEKDLGAQGLQRAVVVASTSEDPAPLRVRAGFVAATIAEYFRDQGKDVLLLMDSVTRIAMAQRQIGLAIDEPPATKGFTPSVFALLPSLVERSGRTAAGSVTGFYTVLVEGDDLSEPIADAMRGILDGHIWLSRDLANRGHYPAIDVLESISRIMPDVTGEPHRRRVRDIVGLIAVYRDIEDLVNIGAYAPGTSGELDRAVGAQPHINQFLQQGITEAIDPAEAGRQFEALYEAVQAPAGRAAAGPAKDKPSAAKPAAESVGLERMMAGL
ncbi:MAG: FliI/YscN family ATPase [Sedimentisphaerales bacterium]|nr:FliI/YscN family ATPase [Sedimentisphaerales bacterium]